MMSFLAQRVKKAIFLRFFLVVIFTDILIWRPFQGGFVVCVRAKRVISLTH